MMKIALIAHDQKKPDIIRFATAYKPILQHHELFATGTTGQKIAEATNLPVYCYRSGPHGGDQQIGARIAQNEMDIVLFFRDPLTAQPHEPDITALIRLCDVYEIPLATNMAGAEILVHALERGELDWRTFIHEGDEDDT